MRVLVIDGSLQESESLARQLQTLGHEARTAATPREAFVRTLRFAPELIFSELHFEADNSDNWLRKLRRHPVLADSRFVAVTARSDAATLTCARETGFEYVLVKPVHLFALEEYLVGVSSPVWRKQQPTPHPWPARGDAAVVMPRHLSEDRPDGPLDREGVEEFLRAMQELSAEHGEETGDAPARPIVIPPVALLRYLDAIHMALGAADRGDRSRGHQILHDGLARISAAPPQPWSEALAARYHLALRTYCALQHFGYPHPDIELP